MEKYIEKLKYYLAANKKNKKVLYLAVIVVATFTAFSFLYDNGDDIVVDVSQDNDSVVTEEATDKSNDKLFIDISGQVNNPGVYEVDSGSRLFQVIEMAGGLTKKAYIDSINQAEAVTDGQKIIIPSIDSKDNDATKSEESNLININTADASSLQSIKGIGPVTAQNIIEYRENSGPFTTIEDIKKVSGIGDKTFDKLKNSICV